MYTVRRAAALLAFLCGAAFGVSLLWTPVPPAAFHALAPSAVPLRLGKWQSAGDYVLPADVHAALGSGETLSRLYQEDAARSPIDFVLIGGTDRTALHDPRSCLMGGGWRVQNEHGETLPRSGGITVRACQAVREREGGATEAFDMVYWYVVDNRVCSSVSEIRAEMLMSALVGRQNRPVYFFRFMVPLSSDPATRAADHDRLCALGAEAWKSLAPQLTAK